MISLGQASNYNFARALGHLFAHGGEKDSVALRNELASRYGAEVENVALYHSGRSALTVALEAVAKPGSKVIIPGLTCIAVVQALTKYNKGTSSLEELDVEPVQHQK